MKKVIWIALLVLIASVGSAAAQDMPTRDQLPPANWMQIAPGGETVCGHGAPYSFYYREGSGQDLLIYFQGGGMCWNGQTCSPTPDKTFDHWVDPNDGSDNPAIYPVGIWDYGNGENPFINYDVLYVNYCTGDMHTGNNVQGYDYNGTWFEVKHKGAVNAAAALNWVYSNIPVPDSVFVAGCSAGSVGAAYWASDIRSHYAGRRVSLLGDSGGGWRGITGDTWTLWGANYQGVTGGNLNIPRFYVGAARAGVRTAQFNTIADETQSFFAGVGFSTVPYDQAIRANLNDVARGASSFRSYTGDGTLHCIFPRGDFYSYSSNAVRIRDWVAEFAAGNAVSNLLCTSCV